MKTESTMLVVPWHNEAQLTRFLTAWNIHPNQIPDWLVLQQDANRSGCAATKNRGVREAIVRGASIVVVLDDDCFPATPGGTLQGIMASHAHILHHKAEVNLFRCVTKPISRGTPYHERRVAMPVAASMGFWTEIGDYDAPGQLVHGARTPMEFYTAPVFGKYFPLCGMNLAFRPKEWLPWCEFIDVPRFDDIWMGWLFQKEAYRRGHCFALNGPLVRHSRQSNVWQNLRDEAVHLERNETLWRDIATATTNDYDELRRLLPV